MVIIKNHKNNFPFEKGKLQIDKFQQKIEEAK